MSRFVNSIIAYFDAARWLAATMEPTLAQTWSPAEIIVIDDGSTDDSLLVAGRDCAIAPADEYVTLPVEPEATACRAVMHHYVANSKRAYFQRNWLRATLTG